METIDISIQVREEMGKGKAGRVRRGGQLPGIFYGPKAQPVPLKIDRKELLKRISDLGASHLIRMKSDSSLLDDKVALIKQVQMHPVTGDVIHVDLYEVDLQETLTVKVPLHFEGKAQGVVRGGILQPIVREIEVECLPQNIPSHLTLDVSLLDIGDALHVSSLSLPEGVTPLAETDLTLVTVVAPSVEEAPKAAEAAPEAAAEGAAAAPGAGEEKKPAGESDSK